jgi:hypothetical protein
MLFNGNMRNIIFIIIGIAVYSLFFGNNNFLSDSGSSVDLFIPEVAAKQRLGSGIKTYEFDDLFEQNRLFPSLAKKGYYTVIEGYINTCSICKRLEADFPRFLKNRKDVLIRKVHFSEGPVNISYNSEAELDDYMQQLGLYNFTHVVKKGASYDFKVCGTPHVEIYGPDKQLIVSDICGEKDTKSGLAFLRNWIKSGE